MARNVADLVKEMEFLGIPLTTEMTAGRGNKKLMMDALAVHKNQGKDLLPQIEVMLCRDAKEWVDITAPDPYDTPEMQTRFWLNDGWIAEEKLDGNRLKMHFTASGIRSDSRRRSDDTYTYSEKTGNFPHLEFAGGPNAVMMDAFRPFPESLIGTILDGEVLCPKAVVDTGSVVTTSTQQSTSAIVNSGPEKSIKIQRDNDAWVEYHAFDVIMFKGESVEHLPWSERRGILEAIIEALQSQPNGKYWHVTRVALDQKYTFFREIIESGGEGVILKDSRGKYEQDKRSKGQYKLKRYQTQDGYIVGWIPGEGGNEGLVGAVEVATNINGQVHKFASVSQFTMEQRLEMTAPDGSLRPEYYNQVMEVRGQILTKNGRFQHAVFLNWRPDKSADMCDGYELKSDLELLGFTFGPDEGDLFS